MKTCLMLNKKYIVLKFYSYDDICFLIYASIKITINCNQDVQIKFHFNMQYTLVIVISHLGFMVQTLKKETRMRN